MYFPFGKYLFSSPISARKVSLLASAIQAQYSLASKAARCFSVSLVIRAEIWIINYRPLLLRNSLPVLLSHRTLRSSKRWLPWQSVTSPPWNLRFIPVCCTLQWGAENGMGHIKSTRIRHDNHLGFSLYTPLNYRVEFSVSLGIEYLSSNCNLPECI